MAVKTSEQGFQFTLVLHIVLTSVGFKKIYDFVNYYHEVVRISLEEDQEEAKEEKPRAEKAKTRKMSTASVQEKQAVAPLSSTEGLLAGKKAASIPPSCHSTEDLANTSREGITSSSGSEDEAREGNEDKKRTESTGSSSSGRKPGGAEFMNPPAITPLHKKDDVSVVGTEQTTEAENNADQHNDSLDTSGIQNDSMVTDMADWV